MEPHKINPNFYISYHKNLDYSKNSIELFPVATLKEVFELERAVVSKAFKEFGWNNVLGFTVSDVMLFKNDKIFCNCPAYDWTYVLDNPDKFFPRT